MTPRHVLLTEIQRDESAQVRFAIDAALVADYSELMRGGARFPPITVFTDGGPYYLADGHHRYLAVQRLGYTAIAAEVQDGTKDDALWFALGANRTHGQRLTERDKTHAVTLALAAWPEKMQHVIAAQVGCSTSLVSKVANQIAGRTDGPSALWGRRLQIKNQRDDVRTRLLAGQSVAEIRGATRAHPTLVASVRRELSPSETPRTTTQERHAHMREMAGAGHTSIQIAAAVGISAEHCREALRKAGVAVPGDKLTRGLRHHDSTRIMAQIVADAGNLAAGANFIDFSALDRSQFADWMDTLRQARALLGTFVRRLAKEQMTYDREVATEAVEDPSGADRGDARPAGVGGPA